MICELEGIVKLMERSHKKTVIFGIFKQDISLLLNYFVALELGRASCIVIKHNRNCVKISMKDNLQFHVIVDGIELSGLLTKNQRDMIKCCCMDNLLYKGYDHVDFEHGICDFTFKVYLQNGSDALRKK